MWSRFADPPDQAHQGSGLGFDDDPA